MMMRSKHAKDFKRISRMSRTGETVIWEFGSEGKEMFDCRICQFVIANSVIDTENHRQVCCRVLKVEEFLKRRLRENKIKNKK